MFFIPWGNCRALFLTKICPYLEIFSTTILYHIVAFFETSVLREVRFLRIWFPQCSASNSEVQIPKSQNKAIGHLINLRSIFFFFLTLPHFSLWMNFVKKFLHNRIFINSLAFIKWVSKAGVRRYFSEKFPNIHEKTPILESLFNNVAGLDDCNFTEKRL